MSPFFSTGFGKPRPDGEDPGSRPDAGGVDEALAAGERPVAHGALPRTVPDADDARRSKEESLGYRASKRSSRTGKAARRLAKVERVKADVSEGAGIAADRIYRVVRGILIGIVSSALVIVLLWLTALGINAYVRWAAKRAATGGGREALAESARENLLVIGADGDRAIGFLAMRNDRKGDKVLAIAIPDGAFMEVPGQGFERVGASYKLGPDVSKDAVSNYLYVPFRRYVVLDAESYQELLKDQDVSRLLDKAKATDLKSAEKAELRRFLTGVDPDNVWIAPLPVKPVSIGDESYFEPQRAEIADLLLKWWNVRLEEQRRSVRVAVYNGAGTPGVAGTASRQLIRAGFRVVDSKNADSFGYKHTLILLYHGTESDARRVRDAIGVGRIKTQPVEQDVADIIVVVGLDYVPPRTGN